MDALVFYKLLADETRLKSLLLLESAGELCVCDLMTALELSQPKVSRHLADLRNNQVVEATRKGKWVFYRIHPDLPSWMKQILQLTVQDSPTLISAEQSRLIGSRCAPNDDN